jgi:hypothetical protein
MEALSAPARHTGRVSDTEPTAPGRPVPPDPAARPAASDAEPVLPSVTRDEREVGWGDEPGQRDDEWYLRERPPHHGG